MLMSFFQLLWLCIVLGLALVPAPSVHAKPFEVGQNFTGIKNAEVTYRVPDTMGSVGPDHVMEFINGRYAVFNKSGTRLTPLDNSTTLDGFWAGLGISNAGAFDPRIVYDKDSQRWFATAASGSRLYYRATTFSWQCPSPPIP